MTSVDFEDGAQEHHWAGRRGDRYTDRNRPLEREAVKRTNFWQRCFRKIKNPRSLVEFGPNSGINLHSIQLAFPDLPLSGIELNKKACEELEATLPSVAVHNDNVATMEMDETWDVVLIKGVLIHITNDEKYEKTLENMAKHANRYVVIVDHVSDEPKKVRYYERDDLWLVRNFPIDFIDKCPNWRIIDMGFFHRNDVSKDLTDDIRDMRWFVFERLT